MATRRLLVIALGLIFALSCASAFAQTNLVVNGSMDAGPIGTGGQIADNWTKWNSTPGTPAYWHMTEQGRTFQRMIGGNWGQGAYTAGFYQAVPVTPGATYDLTFWGKAADLHTGPSTCVKHAYFGYDLTGQTIDGVASTIDYREVYHNNPFEDTWAAYGPFHFTVPAGVTSVSLWARLEIQSPVDTVILMDIDDVVMTESILTNINVTSGPTVTALGTDTATITWTTDKDCYGQVDYGTELPYTLVQDGAGAFGTSHSITLTGLTPGERYHFSVLSENPGVYNEYRSLDAEFTTIAPSLMNGDFEAAKESPWTKFGTFDGIINGDFFGAIPHSPTHLAGAAASWGTKNYGGYYQRVAAVPGSWYRAQSYIWTWTSSSDPNNPAHSYDVGCRVGIDPTGGTDINSANIQWSTFQYTQAWNNLLIQNGWTQIGTAAQAQGNVITVFIQDYQAFAYEWNVTALDDVSLGLLTDGSGNPVNVNHIGKAKVFLGEGYPASFTSKQVTNSWMAENGDVYLYLTETDNSAGIKVHIPAANATEAIPVGSVVNVSGNLMTEAGELTVVNAKASVVGMTGTVIKPFAMQSKVVACGTLGGQRAIPQGFGLSNVGQRVRVFGHITGPYNPGSTGGYFYLDDGSAVLNDTAGVGGIYGGIKVYYTEMNTVLMGDGTEWAGVTGNAGVEYDAATGLFLPVIRVANDNEIQVSFQN